MRAETHPPTSFANPMNDSNSSVPAAVVTPAPLPVPTLVVVGLSYKTAPAEERARFAFSESELPNALTAVKALGGFAEVTILSTCNRTEIYAVIDLPEAEAVAALRGFLAIKPACSSAEVTAVTFAHAGDAWCVIFSA